MSEATARRIRGWLRDQALPLWATNGDGKFAERLTPEGEPDAGAPRRIMVQARQIYVYSHAVLLGLIPDLAPARAGFDFVMRYGTPDGAENGFVHALDSRGVVRDATRDLYDHAFLLLGFSWFYRAGGDVKALHAMDAAALAIEKLRAAIGYRENNLNGLPRRLNSHMHLLEAFLAAHAAGKSGMLERASDVVAMLSAQFLKQDMLLEYFDADWQPAPPPEGAIVEPGHHQEWVWLLEKYGHATNCDMTPVMRALYDAARPGVEEKTGLLYNEIWTDGHVRDRAKRLWPQTELLKAELVLGMDADQTVERIFHHFLDNAPGGTWNDRLDEHNVPLKSVIPASSLYHVFLAFSEYLCRSTAARPAGC